MLALADEGGREGLGNADSTYKNAFKRAKMLIVIKISMQFREIKKKYSFFVCFCHAGREGQTYADKAGEAKEGGWANVDIGGQS